MPRAAIQMGRRRRHHDRQKGSGDIWTKARYGDFVLELEFKTTGNSGVFFRTDNPKDRVQTGIEIQVDNPGEPGQPQRRRDLRPRARRPRTPPRRTTGTNTSSPPTAH